jgi:hypothetical protein
MGEKKPTSAKRRTTPTPPPSTSTATAVVPTAGSILDDLASGETSIVLARLRHQPFMPSGRGGRPLNPCVIFRWASTGKAGIKLETLQTPTGMITTKSAVLRFFARQHGSSSRHGPAAERPADPVGLPGRSTIAPAGRAEAA